MNEIPTRRTWWKQNMKWFVPLAGVFILAVGFFISTMFGSHFNNFAQAYAEDSLVENAVAMAQENARVNEVIGEMEPVGKMAILNGDVKYSSDNNVVDLTVKIKGSKATAMMDVSAERAGEQWEYQNITIRIKNPEEKRETIRVVDQK